MHMVDVFLIPAVMFTFWIYVLGYLLVYNVAATLQVDPPFMLIISEF